MENEKIGMSKAHLFGKKDRNESVKQLQNEFLLQISEGKEAKEAFYESIKAVKEKNSMSQDELRIGSVQKNALYECHAKGIEGEIKAKITPEEVSKWLDVLKKAGPIVLAFLTWLDNFIDKHIHNKNKNNSEQAQIIYKTENNYA